MLSHVQVEKVEEDECDRTVEIARCDSLSKRHSERRLAVVLDRYATQAEGTSKTNLLASTPPNSPHDPKTAFLWVPTIVHRARFLQ